MLNSVREFMAARPSGILRPEALLGQKRVGHFLSRLKSKEDKQSCHVESGLEG